MYPLTTDSIESLHRQLPSVPKRLVIYSSTSEKYKQALPSTSRRTHPYYIAPGSEYGFISALTLFFILHSTVKYFHGETFSTFFFKICIFIFFWIQLRWGNDMRTLGNSLENFTDVVRKNISMGVILFIVSEIMIFFGVFWAYFHSSLNPSVELGAVWPPKNLESLEWWKWPTLSTALLVFSGFSVNVFFYGLRALQQRNMLLLQVLNSSSEIKLLEKRFFENSEDFKFYLQPYVTQTTDNYSEYFKLYFYQLQLLYGGLIYTIFFGFLFLLCQRHEYGHATYDITDGAYGTVFYSITGLHGLHVLIGLLLLIYTLFRLLIQDFQRSTPHVGVAGAVWYWHFVDIVWIFVYILVYCWGSRAGLLSEEK